MPRDVAILLEVIRTLLNSFDGNEDYPLLAWYDKVSEVLRFEYEEEFGFHFALKPDECEKVLEAIRLIAQ